MKEKLTSGIAWVMFATLASKVLTVFAQVVLGYYLAIEDFGIYATALGMTAVFSWLKNGSILQLIIKEAVVGGSTRKFFKFANGLNVVSSFGLFGFAYLYWDDANYIGFLMLSFALAQLFSLPQLKIRSSCSASGRFKALGYYELGQSLLNNLTVVFFAILLGDERCFVFSILAIVFYDFVINHFYFKSEKPNSKDLFGAKEIKQVWYNARWLLLGSLGSSMVMQGAFLIIGFWETDKVLGLYFFAFQLISVFGVIVGEAIRKVLMPVLSSIKNESDRFESLNSTLKYCAALIVPISFGAAIAIGPVMDVLWAGKWIDAVVAAQLMAATLFMPILVLLCYSYLEASGLWRIRNIMQVIDGLLLLFLICLGSVFGGVVAIASCAVLRRLISGLFQLYFVFNRIEKKSSSEIFFYILGACLVSAIVAAISMIFLDFYNAGNIIRILTAILVVMVSVLIIFLWQYPREVQILKSYLKSKSHDYN